MPRGGSRPGAGRKTGWAERGEKGGRPKGSVKEGSRPFRSFSVSCHHDEYDIIRKKAEEKGVSISRFLVELALMS